MWKPVSPAEKQGAFFLKKNSWFLLLFNSYFKNKMKWIKVSGAVKKELKLRNSNKNIQ